MPAGARSRRKHVALHVHVRRSLRFLQRKPDVAVVPGLPEVRRDEVIEHIDVAESAHGERGADESATSRCRQNGPGIGSRRDHDRGTEQHSPTSAFVACPPPCVIGVSGSRRATRSEAGAQWSNGKARILAHFLELPSNAVLCRPVPRRYNRRSRLTIRSRAMDKPFHGETSALPASEDRLDSWKEIATYLNRDVTTVQRWEKREGMPVHRHLHDKMGSVYAFRTELDGWARSRHLRAPENGSGDLPKAPDAPAPSASSTSRITPTFVAGLVAAGVAVAIGAGVWLRATEFFWRSPIADARFQRVTDFDGVEQAAAVSRDGRFVAFLSDRDGRMDVWVTQVGSGQFHNLTRGSAPELVNPSVRLLGFSPDGSFVTFWVRRQDGSRGRGDQHLGGLNARRPAEAATSKASPSPIGPPTARDSCTTRPDPEIRCSSLTPAGGPRAVASSRLPPASTLTFPLWAPDGRFIYFVQGSLPDQLDIWRISPEGGPTERITSHNGRVSHPVLLNRRTLVYLASDPDGSGPWLHSVDVERRIPHRLSSGVDRYTSLAASGDGRRLVATLASPKRTLWRLPIGDSAAEVVDCRSHLADDRQRVLAATGSELSPVCRRGRYGSESIWKLADGIATELWTGSGSANRRWPRNHPRWASSRVLGPDRRADACCMSCRPTARTRGLLPIRSTLQGAPAWAPDGQSITSAVADRGTPHLFRVPVDGRVPSPFVDEYSVDPAWAPDGRFVVYSGPDVGTTFSVKAVTSEAAAHPLPTLTPHSRGSTPGLHAWRADARASARRDPTQGSLADRPRDRRRAAVDQPLPRLRDSRFRHLPGWP